MIVGWRAATEGRAATGGVHQRAGVIFPAVLPAAIWVGKGVEESMSMIGGVGVFRHCGMLSEHKATDTDGRSMKSHTCVGLYGKWVNAVIFL